MCCDQSSSSRFDIQTSVIGLRWRLWFSVNFETVGIYLKWQVNKILAQFEYIAKVDFEFVSKIHIKYLQEKKRLFSIVYRIFANFFFL
jgi:hypothetical protein